MNEPSKAGRPVGRVRRVTGLVLIVLGAACWADMSWLLVYAGSAFGRDEWVRFTFWLWAGALLALTGCWLRYRSRAAAGAAVVWVAVLFAMAYIHDHWAR